MGRYLAARAEHSASRDALAWREAKRMRRLKPAQRRRLQVLTVWCESGRCCVGRVYRLKLGLLLDCRGEGDLRFLGTSAPPKPWGQSSTVWLGDEHHRATVPITCDCMHTTSRALSIQAILEAVQNERRNVGVLTVARSDH